MLKTKSGLRLTLIGALLLATGCASNRFQAAAVTELRVDERQTGKGKRTISDPAALHELIAVLSRASVGRNSDQEVQARLWRGWHLYVAGAKKARGTWLYDPVNGRIARMDIWSGNYVYTIQPQDRAKFAALLH
jgi:hypothetical protein